MATAATLAVSDTAGRGLAPARPTATASVATRSDARLERRFASERASRSAVVGSTTAPSTTAPVDRAPGWEGRLGAAALERLHYEWSRIGYEVRFLPARRGYLGLTFPARHLIVLYVRSDSTVDGLARNTAHELGHALDRVRNTAAMRAQYETIRGIGHGRSWYPCNACTDLATPAGDFAETFSYWLMGGAFPSRSRLAGPPDAGQLAQLVPFFEAPGVHSDA